MPDGVKVERYIANECGVYQRNTYDSIGHGTFCYFIFKSYIKAKYMLFDIKVLDQNMGGGSCSSLINALEWCREMSVDVINMSMGTRQYIDFEPIYDK